MADLQPTCRQMADFLRDSSTGRRNVTAPKPFAVARALGDALGEVVTGRTEADSFDIVQEGAESRMDPRTTPEPPLTVRCAKESGMGTTDKWACAPYRRPIYSPRKGVVRRIRRSCCGRRVPHDFLNTDTGLATDTGAKAKHKGRQSPRIDEARCLMC
jgi:hypothetical protein